MWSPSPDSTPSDTNKPQSLLSVPWSHLVKITCHMSRKEKKNCCHRTVVLCRVSAKRTPNHLKSNISLPCTLVEVLPLQATETASGYRQLGRWGLETPKTKFSSNLARRQTQDISGDPARGAQEPSPRRAAAPCFSTPRPSALNSQFPGAQI